MFSQTVCRPMEILLVEDGLLDARVTILALGRCSIHHRVTLVRSISEALAFVRQEGVFRRAPQPDLVLLDLLLPDGKGTDLLRDLRQMPNLSEVPVVVLTASGDPENRTICSTLKVDDYIEKPVDEDKFLRVVREHKRLLVFGARALRSVFPEHTLATSP
ncbi:Response regulator rcp1 [Rosistilla ulvae]|uniref:Response regulator rcp1 n=1 Tax=Rosistilla ulvae TaxID=1930277 RepID=A0A517M6C7_9BACT|nr:response regulator [Rosistilla ulvae]QDS90416.1 Response regulator rcp1 [Rosistilla ulvae]